MNVQCGSKSTLMYTHSRIKGEKLLRWLFCLFFVCTLQFIYSLCNSTMLRLPHKLVSQWYSLNVHVYLHFYLEFWFETICSGFRFSGAEPVFRGSLCAIYCHPSSSILGCIYHGIRQWEAHYTLCYRVSLAGGLLPFASSLVARWNWNGAQRRMQTMHIKIVVDEE